MTQLAISQASKREAAGSDWDRLRQLGGVAAWVQLACLLLSLVIGAVAGWEPATAAEHYAALQHEGIAGLLRLDFATLLLVALMPFVTVGLYAVLRHTRPAYALLGMVLILVGALLALANHSAFSMIHLSELHAAATTVAAQEQLLTAGEAVLASNMWNSTAGFLAGLFMQGGFVFISFIMLRGKAFSKGTAYTGMLANGLDFIHVPVALVWPSLAATILAVGGVFYLIWFPLLGRDLMIGERRVK
jgi:hypothetical protein